MERDERAFSGAYDVTVSLKIPWKEGWSVTRAVGNPAFSILTIEFNKEGKPPQLALLTENAFAPLGNPPPGEPSPETADTAFAETVTKVVTAALLQSRQPGAKA